MAAISISNAVDIGPREKREARYMEIVKRYQPEELQKFPQMFGELTLALEDEPSDVLGQTFHDLELHNKLAGQFFTPYVLCRMMAKMIVGNAPIWKPRSPCVVSSPRRSPPPVLARW